MNSVYPLPLTHAEATGSKPARVVRAAARLALVLCRDDARLCLFVRHPVKGLELPGGAIEPGETPQEASLRELEEEAGIQWLVHQPATLVALHPVSDACGGSWLDIIYRVVVTPVQIAIRQEAELPVCWLTSGEIEQQVSHQISSYAVALAALQTAESCPQ
jgi:8-oxo-dGTP pyrophosphatase MutT (NUDIX family)